MAKSFIAGVDIPAYSFVKFSGDTIVPAESGSDYILGVTYEAGIAADFTADVFLNGEYAEIRAGEAFAAGTPLTADEYGRAAAASSGDNIGAIALEAAEAEGDIVKVVVNTQYNTIAEAAEEASEESTDDTTDSTTEDAE